jgi:hypothetical protein
LVRLQAPRPWTPAFFHGHFFASAGPLKTLQKRVALVVQVSITPTMNGSFVFLYRGVGDSLQVFLGGVSLTEGRV